MLQGGLLLTAGGRRGRAACLLRSTLHCELRASPVTCTFPGFLPLPPLLLPLPLPPLLLSSPQVTSTYTYLVACPKTGEAVLIDSVQEKVDRDVALINQLGLKLLYSIGTHVHADHVTGTAAMRKKLPGLQSVIAEPSAKADVHVKEGDVLKFGERSLKVLSTAGHTDGCISLVLDDESMVFTGDALFVRGCGRTDFQQGHAGQLYDNIHGKLFTLPGSCKVYPGHDYNGHLFSTIAEERRFNPRLTKSREDFIALMAGLNLPPPKFLDVAVPANMLDGEAPPPAAAAGVAGVEVSAGAAAAATAPAGSK